MELEEEELELEDEELDAHPFLTFSHHFIEFLFSSLFNALVLLVVMKFTLELLLEEAAAALLICLFLPALLSLLLCIININISTWSRSFHGLIINILN